MKKFLRFLPLLFLLAGCEKDRLNFIYREYPVQSLHVRLDGGKTVINDEARFQEVFAGYADRLPPVDFDKYTLVVTGGPDAVLIDEIYSEITRDDAGKYRIELSVLMSDGFTNGDPWYRAFVISKTRPEDVTLEVEFYKPMGPDAEE